MASLDAARERGYELRPGASEADIESLAAFAPAPAELMDLFGYRVLPGDEERNDINRWEHEDDSRSWFALSVGDYFTRRE